MFQTVLCIPIFFAVQVCTTAAFQTCTTKENAKYTEECPAVPSGSVTAGPQQETARPERQHSTQKPIGKNYGSRGRD